MPTIEADANYVTNTQRGTCLEKNGVVIQTCEHVLAALVGLDIDNAIIAASRRGVEITMLFSKEANIGNDINYKTVASLYRKSQMTIYLSDKMIHSKLD